MSGGAFDDTEQVVLLLVVVSIGLIGAPVLLVGVSVIVVRRIRRHRPFGGTLLRAAAGLAACTAVAVYAWGALHLTQDESGARELCQASIPQAHRMGPFTYDVSFLPLRGECRVDGVGTFDARSTSGSTGSLVPGYVNPTVAGAICLAIVCFIVIRRFPDGGSPARGDTRAHNGPGERDRAEGPSR